jgi:Zn finger protein HypA/HybF involved in hydrogenase expression
MMSMGDRTVVAYAERDTMQTASLIVDIKTVRCSQCKMMIRDVTVANCPHCGAAFDRVTSNHVGLAARVQREREAKKVDAQTS